MGDTLYYQTTASFEAALQLGILPRTHQASRVHGHSYQITALFPAAEPDCNAVPQFERTLNQVVAPLNYSFLNDKLQLPVDENLAQWIAEQTGAAPGITLNLQSTAVTGAVYAPDGQITSWQKFHFSAAHQLPNVEPGHPCGRMHGHTFELYLWLKNTAEPAQFMVNHPELERVWQPLREKLDHQCLNDIPGLENPTSEILCQWIWKELKPQLSHLCWVTVRETHSSGCHFDGEHYRIWKEQNFESALQISQAKDAKQRRLHGHSYRIRLHLQATLDSVYGWTVDYGDVKAIFRPVLNQLDHYRLDHIEGVTCADPATLLYWIRTAMDDRLKGLDRLDLFTRAGAGASLRWGAIQGPF